jgi:hypothetical protein
MNKKLNKRRVRRSDYLRVLVTETGPLETPVIFSNDRFYKNLRNPNGLTPFGKKFAAMLESIDDTTWTKPYNYKIKKTSSKYRCLSVLHPSAQIKIADFYRRYEEQILNACGLSPLSIRTPTRVARTFFIPGEANVNNKFKEEAVTDEANDDETTFSVTYFAYRYTRLYKFFDSADFSRMEMKYGYMKMLDTSRCFDSIYTHSIGWALAGKEVTKNNLKTFSFGESFDKLMHKLNDGETNGIPIGPEVSRIFAEIILQRVDVNVLRILEVSDGIKLGHDFEIKRYVDDIIIFGAELDTVQRVEERYIDALRAFNLNLNDQKTVTLKRPFATLKSRVVRECKIEIADFLGKLVHRTTDEKIEIKKIFHPLEFAGSFIKNIRSLCLGEGVDYEQVSGVLISILTRNLMEIVDGQCAETEEERRRCKDALLVIFDVLFFLYTVSPSVLSSYKVAASIITIGKFVAEKMPAHAGTIKTRISELAGVFIRSTCMKLHKIVGTHVSLEVINVLLAVKGLGRNYQLDDMAVELVFGPMISKKTPWSYFDMVSCLYYIGDNVKHQQIRLSIESAIDSKLKDLTDCHKDSEKAHLLLDSVSCPFLDIAKRKSWITAALKWIDGVEPPEAEVQATIASKEYWFIT